MLAAEVAKVVTLVNLMDALDNLRLLVLGLAVLVLLLGFFLTRGQQRIARNQVELAKLVRGECRQGGGD
jgi:hypothetical protein